MRHRGSTLLLAICLLSACEKADVGEDEREEPTAQVVVPTALGLGTQEAPHTADQVLSGEGLTSGLRWYAGYVVGSTYSTMKNAVFEAETSYTTNVLIASRPDCDSVAQCVPVELKSATLQQAFSLHYNSERFRQCIVLRGRFGQYFRTNGIRDVQEGYWLPGFSLESIDATPSEWEEWHQTY